MSRSNVSVGVRRATLESTTDAVLQGVPDWFLPEGFAFPFPGIPVTHTVYIAEFAARRDFEGFGPILSWDAAAPLVDWNDGGRVEVDWSVSGGVLFGDRATSVTRTEEARYSELGAFAMLGLADPPPPTLTVAPPLSYARSGTATAPTIGASLGLSYSIDRFSIGAGYRWERYSDVIDGGFAEEEEEDRTIDGPYFKMSLGFGG